LGGLFSPKRTAAALVARTQTIEKLSGIWRNIIHPFNLRSGNEKPQKINTPPFYHQQHRMDIDRGALFAVGPLRRAQSSLPGEGLEGNADWEDRGGNNYRKIK